MWSRIKGYLLFASAISALYFLLSHHIIFYGHEAALVQNVYLLSKTKLNLHHTFFSLHQKKPEAIMRIEQLREAGIGDLLFQLGLLTGPEKNRLENLYR
jgi:hypothetical protein